MTAPLVRTHPTTTDRTDPWSRRPTTVRLVLVELRKSVDTRAGRWLLVAMALASVAVVGLQLGFAPDEERTLQTTFAGQQGIITVLLPVVGILLVTSEWSTRSVMTTYTLVPQRYRTTVAKIGAGTLLALGSVVVNLAIAVLGVATAQLLGAGGGTADTGRWELSAALVAQSALMEVVTVVAGVGFGLALLSSPLAIVLYFVLPLVLSIVRETVTALRGTGEWLDINLTLPRLQEAGMDGRDWAQLATSVACWCLLPLALGVARVARREPT